MTKLQIQIPGYEDADVIGLPSSGKCVVITDFDRQLLGCMKKWWFVKGEGLRTKNVSKPLRYDSGWDLWLEDLNGWWMEHDTEYPGNGHACVWCKGTGKAMLIPTGELSEAEMAALRETMSHSGGAMSLTLTLEEHAPSESCGECHGTGDGPLARIAENWRQAFRDLHRNARVARKDLWITRDEVEKQIETLFRAAHGYLCKYGAHPPKNVKVVGVKVAIAAPVLIPGTDKIYRPTMWAIEEPDGPIRLALSSEAQTPPLVGRLFQIRWPWYQVVKLDRLAASRKTGALWIGEYKSSQTPRAYVEAQEQDPQVAGSMALLEHVVRAGLMAGEATRFHAGGIAADTGLGGYAFDCVSSVFQKDPHILKPRPPKKPKEGEAPPPPEPHRLSIAKNQRVPTWRFDAFCVQHGIDPAEYSAFRSGLARVDKALYVREWGGLGPAVRDRYRLELYGVACRHAQAYRDAATADEQSEQWRFPRVASCRLAGSSCSYAKPCIEDSNVARESFRQADQLLWAPQEDQDHG